METEEAKPKPTHHELVCSECGAGNLLMAVPISEPTSVTSITGNSGLIIVCQQCGAHYAIEINVPTIFGSGRLRRLPAYQPERDPAPNPFTGKGSPPPKPHD